MISLKQGVTLAGIKPEILIGLTIVAAVFEKLKYDTVVTSALDGEHQLNSLHPKGLALDVRSHDISTKLKRRNILAKCKAALGDNFDMILEDEGTANEHFHLEFDPGRRFLWHVQLAVLTSLVGALRRRLGRQLLHSRLRLQGAVVPLVCQRRRSLTMPVLLRAQKITRKK